MTIYSLNTSGLVNHVIPMTHYHPFIFTLASVKFSYYLAQNKMVYDTP